MKKKDIETRLLQYCRHYRGGDTEDRLAFYEKRWIELTVKSTEVHNELSKMIDEYIRYGLKDFQADDNTPVSLKALLFNRFDRPDAQEFEEWYLKNYANVPTNLERKKSEKQ